MSGLDAEFDRSAPLQILRALRAEGKLPHALLFTGAPGVGKLAAARRIAMALNCQSRTIRSGTPNGSSTETLPCNRCRSCRRILSGNHPDILPIRPAGPFIRIDQIRTLRHTLAMKPYEATYRVVIIADAQAMNPPAANALLKVLEEPPQRTILILTASRKSDLLPTIVSRCQRLRFAPLPTAALRETLVAKQGLDPERAVILAAMAGGSLKRASELNRSNWVNRRNWLLNQLADLPALPLGAILALAARTAKKREDFERYLDIMYTWARDLAVCRTVPEKVINRDVIGLLEKAAGDRGIDSILSKADYIQAARRDINANANLRLTAEVLFLRLAEAAGLPYDS